MNGRTRTNIGTIPKTDAAASAANDRGRPLTNRVGKVGPGTSRRTEGVAATREAVVQAATMKGPIGMSGLGTTTVVARRAEAAVDIGDEVEQRSRLYLFTILT